jgi:hypothetical protein
MMASLLVAAVASPLLIALWVVWWLVGDLFASPQPETIPVDFLRPS